MQAVAKHGATLLPTDSEHERHPFQCLSGNRNRGCGAHHPDSERRPLAAAWSAERLAAATPAEAGGPSQLVDLGAKIQRRFGDDDEQGARIYRKPIHLFPVGLERLAIVVHPQSVIHSMVEFRDRSTLAAARSVGYARADRLVPSRGRSGWKRRSVRSILRPSGN